MAKKVVMNVTMVVPDKRLHELVLPATAILQVLCDAVERGDKDGAEYCVLCVKRTYCPEFFGEQVVPLICNNFVFDPQEFTIMQREAQDRRMEARSR